MRVRYRMLSSSFDPKAFGQAFEDEVSRDLPTLNLTGSAMEAAVGAPKKVSAEEGSAELEEVCVLVETGRLKLRDLVNTGEGWQTVSDCPHLDEACDRYRRRRRIRWMIAGPVACALALTGIVLYLLTRG